MKYFLNFITKTNEYYESLSEIKGALFYIGLIFIPYALLMIFLPKPYYFLSIVWPFSVSMWRVAYRLILQYRGK